MAEAQSTVGAEKKKRNFGPKEPVKLAVADVVKMLDDGKTREDIMRHYGFNAKQLKALFMDSRLKGRKTTKDYSKAFIITDPISSNGTEQAVSNDGTEVVGTNTPVGNGNWD